MPDPYFSLSDFERESTATDVRKFAPDPAAARAREFIRALNLDFDVRRQFMTPPPEETEDVKKYGGIRAPRFTDDPSHGLAFMMAGPIAVENALVKLPIRTLPANVIKDRLLKAGASKAELQTRGILEFLESKGTQPVHPTDLVDYIQKHPFRLEETVLGKGKTHRFALPEEQQRLIDEREEAYRAYANMPLDSSEHEAALQRWENAENQMRYNVPGWGIARTGEETVYYLAYPDGTTVGQGFKTIEEAETALDELFPGRTDLSITARVHETGRVGPAKYEAWQTPGESSNYREILLRAPSRKGPIDTHRIAKLELEADRLDELYHTTVAGDTKTRLYDRLTDVYKRLERLKAGQHEFESRAALEDALGIADRFGEVEESNYLNKMLGELGESDRPHWGEFVSAHWDQPNVIAHMRVNDRTLPGAKVKTTNDYVAEYIFGKGYNALTDAEKNIVIAERPNFPHGYFDKRGEKVLHVEEWQSDWASQLRQKDRISVRPEGGQGMPWGVFSGDDIVSSFGTKGEAEKYATDLRAKFFEPRQPLIENWQDLVTRRTLKEAVDGGYDRVTWVTGKQTADRYDLSKHIDRIDAQYLEGGHLEGHIAIQAIDKHGNTILDDAYLPERLPSVIGKEASEKVLERLNAFDAGVEDVHKVWEPKIKAAISKHRNKIVHDPAYTREEVDRLERNMLDDPGAWSDILSMYGIPQDPMFWTEYHKRVKKTSTSLKNLDLKVGGEWAKKLYDESMVNRFNKIGKRYGVKVEKISLAPSKGQGWKITYDNPGSMLEDLDNQTVESYAEAMEDFIVNMEDIYSWRRQGEFLIDEEGRRMTANEALAETGVTIKKAGTDRAQVHSFKITPEMRKKIGQWTFHPFEDVP